MEYQHGEISNDEIGRKAVRHYGGDAEEVEHQHEQQYNNRRRPDEAESQGYRRSHP